MKEPGRLNSSGTANFSATDTAPVVQTFADITSLLAELFVFEFFIIYPNLPESYLTQEAGRIQIRAEVENAKTKLIPRLRSNQLSAEILWALDFI